MYDDVRVYPTHMHTIYTDICNLKMNKSTGTYITAFLLFPHRRYYYTACIIYYIIQQFKTWYPIIYSTHDIYTSLRPNASVFFSFASAPNRACVQNRCRAQLKRNYQPVMVVLPQDPILRRIMNSPWQGVLGPPRLHITILSQNK